MSWASDLVAEMLLILKKYHDLINRGQVLDMTVQEMSHNFVRGQSVAFRFRQHIHIYLIGWRSFF